MSSDNAAGDIIAPPRPCTSLAYRAPDSRDGRVSVLQLSPDGQAVVHDFEADLAARLGRLMTAWPAKKRQAAAAVLTDLIDAIQAGLAEEDAAAQA
ncbi:MAG TPA: hypothetical protein VIY52_11175 [Streptosporangiaceae bacterium]